MFSKACEYGIKSSIYIARESISGNRVNLKQIAASVSSPEAYTAKILQQLVKSGIITSVKGKMGGFEMNPDTLKDIKLVDIIKSIDGDGLYHSCILGLNECDAKKPCALHSRVFTIRKNLQRMLEITTMNDLIDDIDNGLAFLKH
ncbi:RrF2 family transcriptional regulator [Faecalibacter rhinopitheci]|uniref:Rrf2 family transcriptional regulator n=1 Tax=Faecalibacter rhinopitheci TaxID=2779678 RepID=A0A8J7G6M2_9FLAO|nr:Rrf2 family transcriptional regulator [Faecalibacter rhinopitheci]MBF0597782.1 Rrf2 family transcriptional regulator [Faecalibacter rhinopitheci]MBQ0147804.1 Rrf2 family transcriptional regulator [Candidatus Onthonaster equi]